MTNSQGDERPVSADEQRGAVAAGAPSTARRNLLVHGSAYGAARLFNIAAGLLVLPIYAHFIGRDGFGVTELAATTATMFGILARQGLHGAWFRLRFDEDADGRAVLEATIVWYLLGTGLALAGLAALVGTFLGPRWMPELPVWPLGLLALTTGLATIFPDLYERSLQAQQRSPQFAAFSTFRRTLITATIVVAVVGMSAGAAGKIAGEAAASVMLAAFALWRLQPRGPSAVSRAMLDRCLRYGLPLIPHGFAGAINGWFDRIAVNSLLGVGAVGVYSMGYRIGTAGSVIALALNQAFSVVFISGLKDAEAAAARGDAEAAAHHKTALADAGLMMVALVTCFGLAATFAAHEALLVATPVDFHAAWQPVAPVAASVVAVSCYYCFSQSITFNARTVSRLARISALGAVVAIAANYALIPPLGILGAGVATLVSNSVMAVQALRHGRVAAPIPYEWRRWLAVLGAGCLGLTALWMMDLLVPEIAPRVTAKVGCTALAVGAVLYGARINPWVLFRRGLKETLARGRAPR